MSDLWGLAILSFVSAVTPGPNNVMLWASGLRFGMRRTLPHLTGIVVGVGVMVVVVGAGFGLLITEVPAIETTFKVTGSGYLLYLAYQIAGGGGAEEAEIARPLTIFQAAAFQFVNPKAWVFVLAAVSTFRPTDLNVVVGSLAMALVMMLVIIPCAGLWAGAGSILSRYLDDQAESRFVRVLLGLLLAATVVFIWI